MNVVVDASVALKWFVGSESGEADGDRAADLLQEVDSGRLTLIQPPHFVAEVAAVLARVAPSTAERSLGSLLRVEMNIVSVASAIPKAIELSIQLGHHLFDTLYHAVALQTTNALLVTADERYFRKAAPLGSIERLSAFAVH